MLLQYNTFFEHTDIVVEAPEELCQVDERITIQNSLQRYIK